MYAYQIALLSIILYFLKLDYEVLPSESAVVE
jgi:hypothetical protein